jgi:aminopeptidase N
MISRNFLTAALICLIALIGTSFCQPPETVFHPYAIQHHDLSLTLDPVHGTMVASDQIMIKAENPGGAPLELLLRKGLKVTGALLGGKKVKFTQGEKALPSHFEAVSDSESQGYYAMAQVVSVEVPEKIARQGSFTLKLAYEGIVKDSVQGADFSREFITEEITGLIDTVGIYLGSEGIFYQQLPNQLFTFTVNATVPEGYRTISEGDQTADEVKSGKRMERWVNTHPMDGFQVIAGKYQVKTLDHAGVQISTYFFPDPTDSAGSLSQTYLKMSAGYVDLYDSLLGEYPFRKFSVVENFFATGYGMPAFTLLGSEVLRLPFIPYTSLGHEICHNWWGNSVYVDYKTGNWCEGLTTYCADYLYKERKSPADARDYRMGLDQDYTAYTHKANDFPLTDFRVRHNPAQRAVGYGKSAMLYHMLRQQIGDKLFWKGLQRFYKDNVFRYASWAQVQKAFEAETGQDLSPYFKQWVARTGAPQLAIKSPTVTPAGDRWQLSFALEQTQKDTPYLLEVPVRIKGEMTDTTFHISLHGQSHNIQIATGFKPVSIAVDPNFDLFRRLDPAEIPSSLAEVFGAADLTIVLPTHTTPELAKAYEDLAGQLNREGNYHIVKDADLKPEDLNGKALFFMGTMQENAAVSADWSPDSRWEMSAAKYRLLDQSYADGRTAMLVTTRHPRAADISLGWFAARTPQDVTETGRKLTHYGKYSYLVFVAGKNQVKGSWEVTQSPLMVKF